MGHISAAAELGRPRGAAKGLGEAEDTDTDTDTDADTDAASATATALLALLALLARPQPAPSRGAAHLSAPPSAHARPDRGNAAAAAGATKGRRAQAQGGCGG